MSRTEQDFLGQREIADDIYYGVQTSRGKENFHITGIPMNQEPYFVKALGYVKKAAAMANRDLGAVDTKVAEAIIVGCDRVIAGDMMDQFVTDFIQGGAGTSTNMNANEVIANLALESLGFAKGDYQHVSPNDHVNYGQSTNDTYPTAFRLALILRLESYMTALRQLQEAFFTKSCNDIRLLASGPRAGFNEINLPQLQPGSSIMPGKINPVIPEVVNQTSFLVIGLDTTVTLAASAGQLQLNVMEPVISFALFFSIRTMERAVNSLRENCVVGITANQEHTRNMVLNSLGIVTVLKPRLGYKQCAEIAREGYTQGKSLHQIVVAERKLLTQGKWDEMFSFERLINPDLLQ